MSIFFGIWTPNGRGVLKLGPNDCFISHLTYARMSSFYIPFKKAKIFLCIGTNSVDMVSEIQVRRYVEGPGISNTVRGLSMHGIVMPDVVTRSGYVQDLALGWIKRHIPFLKHIQITLKLF